MTFFDYLLLNSALSKYYIKIIEDFFAIIGNFDIIYIMF